MSDIKDINFDDIKQFLITNNVTVSNDENDYNKAFKLMKNSNIIIESISIIEWMMAYNLIIKKVKIRDYTINDLIKLSINERDKLAKNLGMVSDNINNIINILYYLHKLHLVVGGLKIPNNKNVYDIFPKEIWVKILLDLNCEDIDSIIKDSEQLTVLIVQQNIKEKIKTRGFPRPSGHCAAFDVSEFIDEENYSDFDFSAEKLKDQILDKLYNLNYNLVKGDLICFDGLHADRNDGIAIFDGCKIINLRHDIDDYGSLPDEFTVINNGVPVSYWYNTDKNKGIDHNHMVWFDHTPVKKQLIDNIIEVGEELFTTFECNNKVYKIYISKTDLDMYSSKEEFTKILSTNNKILFDMDDDPDNNENILYIALYYYM